MLTLRIYWLWLSFVNSSLSWTSGWLVFPSEGWSAKLIWSTSFACTISPTEVSDSSSDEMLEINGTWSVEAYDVTASVASKSILVGI